jgi:putative transcriptional regulator
MDIEMSHNIYEEEKHESLEGKILVASPHLDDPYFGKSLIYICAHDDSGAIGIMINQRIGMISYGDFIFPGEIANMGTNIKNKKFPLIFGGPVNTDMLIALSLKKNQKTIGSSDIMVHTDVGKFFKDMLKQKNSKGKFIVAKGVSAWDGQQLEEEIAEDSWFVVQTTSSIFF